MAAPISVTLDASTTSYTFSIQPGEHAIVTHDVTGTVTIDWTVTVLGGSNDVPLLNSSDTQVSYTADGSLMILAPGQYTATRASGSGSCDLEAQVWVAVG